MQAIVYAALTGLALHSEKTFKCNSSVAKTCNPWMGVSMALNLESSTVDGSWGKQLQQPLITPEQMTLAKYKLFGVTAATMMGPGPGTGRRKADFTD